MWPSNSNGARDNASEMPRFTSSGSKSVVVVPSSTRPWRLMAPAQKSRASARLVLPAPPWPTRATLRIWAGGKLFTALLLCGTDSLVGCATTSFRAVSTVPAATVGRGDVRQAVPRGCGAGLAPCRYGAEARRRERRPTHRRRPAHLRRRRLRRGPGPPRLGCLPAGRLRRARPARRGGGQGVGHVVAPGRLLRLGRRPGRATCSCSAASPGTCQSVDGGHAAMLPLAVMAASSLVSYERARAESLGLHRPGRAHGAGRAHARPRRRPAVQRRHGADPLADAGPHRCSPPASGS